jgi:hypothetical protein
MKLVIYTPNNRPIEVEAERVRVLCGQDHFEMREQQGLLVRLEEHDGSLAMDLAMFPNGGNGVRLKGGLR